MSGIDQALSLAGRPYRLRDTTAADAPAVLGLFEQVFGERPPEGWYAWKYGEGGLKGRGLGLWNDTGELIAHYAGFPRTLLWQGRKVEAIQIGDVMVAPEVRGFLTRRGPFFQVCSAFFERWVGTGKPYALAYGFPNGRHMQLGLRLGLYVDQGPVEGCYWPARKQRFSWLWRSREIKTDDACFGPSIDAAWAAMIEAMPGRILGVRDAAYVQSRFVMRPGMHYRYILVARRGFGSVALAVWRTDDDMLRWVDFVGPRAALPATTAALQNLAAQLGLAQVETWSSPAAQEDLLATGAQAAATAAYFALAKASHCPNQALASHGWWLGGDTDFL